MHSSGENSRKCKNDSDKRGGYWKYDEASSQMRDTLIQSCAESESHCSHCLQWWKMPSRLRERTGQ
jgi:hypothetical protein